MRSQGHKHIGHTHRQQRRALVAPQHGSDGMGRTSAAHIGHWPHAWHGNLLLGMDPPPGLQNKAGQASAPPEPRWGGQP